MTRRAQAAVEFLVLSGFMVFVFSTFFLVVEQRAEVVAERDLQEEVNNVANIINQEMTIAARVHPGYIRNFELPILISGEPYTITLVPPDAPSEVIITFSNGEEYVIFLNMNLSSGSAIRPGENYIDKQSATNISVRKDLIPASKCVQGDVDVAYIAGGTDFMVSGTGGHGSGWGTNQDARNVVQNPTQFTCCDALTECPDINGCNSIYGWSDVSHAWTCADNGNGPTYYACDYLNAGHQVGNQCCGVFTQSVGGHPLGYAGFDDMGGQDQIESFAVNPSSCTDTYDNDCDGFTDSADPDCP